MKLRKVLSILGVLVVSFVHSSFADVKVYGKDGSELEGKYLGIVDKNAVAIDIGLGGPLILGNVETDHLEYLNDLGIRLSCPPGWYMYTGNSLKTIFPSQTKESMARWAVAFYQYPYGSIKDNPSIALEIQPRKIETPLKMAEMTIAYMKSVTQNFKLIEPPQKILINGLEGIKYVVEYTLFNTSPGRQIIYLFWFFTVSSG